MVDTVEHQIKCQTGAKIISSQQYRASPKQLTVAKAEIDCMLYLSDIERAQSSSASSIVLDSKKDGNSRFCVDFHRLK